jgi:hypothetical protein
MSFAGSYHYRVLFTAVSCQYRSLIVAVLLLGPVKTGSSPLHGTCYVRFYDHYRVRSSTDSCLLHAPDTTDSFPLLGPVTAGSCQSWGTFSLQVHVRCRILSLQDPVCCKVLSLHALVLCRVLSIHALTISISICIDYCTGSCPLQGPVNTGG